MAIIRATGYMAGPDNAYPGHPDGGTDTCSGVSLNERYATAAVRMNNKRINVNVGDIVLITNKINGKELKSLAWVTDVGGLPHGDIDLAKSQSFEKNLGLQYVVATKNGKPAYVTDVKGRGEMSVELIAHVNPKGMGKNDSGAINEGILKVNENIAAHQADPAKSVTPKSTDEIKTELQGQLTNPVLKQQNFEMAKNSQVQENGPAETGSPYSAGNNNNAGRSGGSDGGGSWKRKPEEYTDYLMNMMKENPIMGMFLMMIALFAGIFGGEDLAKMFQKVSGSPNWNNDAARDVSNAASAATGHGGSVTNNYNNNYQVNGAPAGWGDRSKTPDALKAVEEDKTGKLMVYQEIKGNGFKSYGNLIYKDAEGNVKCIPVLSGGAGRGSMPGTANGTGDNNPDGRYLASTIHHYEVGNYSNRVAAGDSGVFGPFTVSLASKGCLNQDNIPGSVTSNDKEQRGAIRFHQGRNASLGCLVFQPNKTAEVQRDMQGLLRQHGTLDLQIKPSTDPNNQLCTIRPAPPVQQQAATSRPQADPAQSGQSMQPISAGKAQSVTNNTIINPSLVAAAEQYKREQVAAKAAEVDQQKSIAPKIASKDPVKDLKQITSPTVSV